MTVGDEVLLEPPRRFLDRCEREILIREVDGATGLAPMYRRFRPEDRAQGLPPPRERLPRWLEELEGALHVVAETADGAREAVGHAFLVPASGTTAELAVFVLDGYREAGIGTALVRCLLGVGAREGFDRIWLVVERTNTPAVRLYRKVGFRTLAAEGPQLEMDLLLPGGAEA